MDSIGQIRAPRSVQTLDSKHLELDVSMPQSAAITESKCTRRISISRAGSDPSIVREPLPATLVCNNRQHGRTTTTSELCRLRSGAAAD